MQSVTSWPSLVRDAELDVRPTQTGDEFAYCRRFIGNATVARRWLIVLGHSCSNAGAVHIQSHVPSALVLCRHHLPTTSAMKKPPRVHAPSAKIQRRIPSMLTR